LPDERIQFSAFLATNIHVVCRSSKTIPMNARATAVAQTCSEYEFFSAAME
jgi:hypothetical protein